MTPLMKRRRLWNPHEPSLSPWMRKYCKPDRMHAVKRNNFGRFDEFLETNAYLDCATKNAALKASPFVVCLTSYTGSQRLFVGSGTIMHSFESEGEFWSTILTSATLLKCPTGKDAMADGIKVEVHLYGGGQCEAEILGLDFHYNVAAVCIKSSVRMETAVIEEDADFPERHGMTVIALGRYFHHPYHIMAVPGEISLKKCKLDCEALCMTLCRITKNGIGGPLVNGNGHVIGMNFYESQYTPVLPINIASKCFYHLQNSREVPRSWLGLKLSNLDIGELEELNMTSPNTFRGIIVKEVVSGSPASRAGICTKDVIIESRRKPVWSSLQFISTLLDDANEPLELRVKRADSIAPLTVMLDAENPKELYRWPLPEEWSPTGFHP